MRYFLTACMIIVWVITFANTGRAGERDHGWRHQGYGHGYGHLRPRHYGGPPGVVIIPGPPQPYCQPWQGQLVFEFGRYLCKRW